MGEIISDFREYLTYYLRDFLSEDPPKTLEDWENILERIEIYTDKNFRFNYLLYFLWCMDERLLAIYRSHPHRNMLFRQANKILTIIDGEFLRFNDYETKRFIVEMQAFASVQSNMFIFEPVVPFFEDIIHFLENFINWHKKKQNIPLKYW
jgi:hypothetical protein